MIGTADVGLRAPWDRRSDESIEAYLEFLRYLHSAPRGIPPQQLALEFDWATRVRSFDESLSLAGKDPVAIGMAAMRQIFAIEAVKHARACAGAPMTRSTMRDCVELGRLFLNLPPAGADVPDVTDDQLQEFENLLAKVRKAR